MGGESPALFSDSWRGFRGVKPLKSLRPYGTARARTPQCGTPARQPTSLFAPERLPEPPQAPISRTDPVILRGFLPRTGVSPMADQDLFFSRNQMDRGRVQQLVDDALKGSDDGELFLE